MRVYCLVGKSGTGKSYKAMYVASLYNIDCIIDDGLLIYKCKVIGGVSAKKEKTKMAAVKRAIFYFEDHKKEVKEKLEEINPQSILIIGTSINMIDHITSALDIKGDYNIINIEDVSTKEEIEIAKRYRFKEGKHVIPVPVFEVKKSFSGYFIDSIKNIIIKDNKKHSLEKTIVRPSFSYLGKYTISERVIKQIVVYVINDITKDLLVNSIKVEKNQEGIKVEIGLVIKKLCKLDEMANIIIDRIKNDIEYMTGINVDRVTVIYKSFKG